jgi:hypothetical protein
MPVSLVGCCAIIGYCALLFVVCYYGVIYVMFDLEAAEGVGLCLHQA